MMLAKSPSGSKFIMIDCGVVAPHMGEVADRWSFSGVLFGKRTADHERSSPAYYTSIDAVSAKEVPLEVSSIHLNP
jgi:hypothetical protein